MPTESPVIAFLNKMADLLLLNLLFLVCCIPVVTIGPALCALYRVSLRSIRYGDGYVVKEFFKGFKENFKQGIVVWIINLIIAVLFIVDLMFWGKVQMGAITHLMLGISVFFATLVLIVSMWVYPVIAKIENRLWVNVKNAAAMAVAHFFPYTLINLLMIVIATYLFLTSIVIDIIMLLIGFALIAYMQSFFYYKVFAKYLNEESLGEDDLLYQDKDK